MTRKPLLADLSRWLGPHADACVVITTTVGADGKHLLDAFRHVEQVPDYDHVRVSHQIVELAWRFGVERIASLNEVDVLRAAAARQLLGIAGQDLPSAVAFRDKYVMKSLVGAQGIPVARMRRFRSKSQGRSAAAELSYPVVVKPVDGGASVGVRRLAHAGEWDSVPESVCGSSEFLVEEWIDESAFFIVDGLMCEGAVTHQVVLRMLSGNLTFLTGRMPVAGWSVAEESDTEQRVGRFVAQVLRALPPVPHETAFHLELFQEHDGRLVLCEVASRPGGMGHVPTFTQATDADLNAVSLLGQLGLSSSQPRPQRRREAAFAYYPRRRGTLARHPDSLMHPSVTYYNAQGGVGEAVDGARWVGDSIAKIVLTAPTGDSICSHLNEVMTEYESGTEWMDRD